MALLILSILPILPKLPPPPPEGGLGQMGLGMCVQWVHSHTLATKPPMLRPPLAASAATVHNNVEFLIFATTFC